MGYYYIFLGYLPCLLFLSTNCFASGSKETPTLSAVVIYGPSTYKSELVSSNDTSYSMSYAVNVRAGNDKSLGVGIRNDTNTTAFELNTSEITTNWQDTFFAYHFDWAYIGLVFSNLSMKVVKEGDDLFELVGQGYGGNLGGQFDFGRSGQFRLDITSVAISQVTEINQQAITFGSRLEIDMGASVDITRRGLEVVFGYKQRTVPVTTSEGAATEALSNTYLGLQGGLSF